MQYLNVLQVLILKLKSKIDYLNYYANSFKNEIYEGYWENKETDFIAQDW